MKYLIAVFLFSCASANSPNEKLCACPTLESEPTIEESIEEHGPSLTMTGVITKVYPTSHMLVDCIGEEKAVIVLIEEHMYIMKGRKRGSIFDLEVGIKVRLSQGFFGGPVFVDILE